MTDLSVTDRVLAQMRASGGFPAMAKTVTDINDLIASETTSTQRLAEAVLHDYGLSQKLLRLANTMQYAQRQELTTVTRAIVVMGFERVRLVASSLVLFGMLEAQAVTPARVDALNMSLFAAMIGRRIAVRIRMPDEEEAFIGALFHNLGRTLVAFYLPKEFAAVKAAGDDLEAGARKVLGVSCPAIGRAVARSLKLPASVGEGMERLSGEQLAERMTEDWHLRAVATLANAVADEIAAPTDGAAKRETIDALVRAYPPPLSSIHRAMPEIVENGAGELKAYSTLFALDQPGSAFAKGLTAWREYLASQDARTGDPPPQTPSPKAR
jgi:HD-like signal output (HDOD) protein